MSTRESRSLRRSIAKRSRFFSNEEPPASSERFEEKALHSRGVELKEAPVICTELAPMREAFTRRTTYGETLIVEISGVFEWRTDQKTWRLADAIYSAGEDGNFFAKFANPSLGVMRDGDARSPGLHFDGRHAPTPLSADRALHCYKFALTGTGSRIGVCLVPPRPFSPTRDTTLAMTVRPPTPDDERDMQLGKGASDNPVRLTTALAAADREIGELKRRLDEYENAAPEKARAQRVAELTEKLKDRSALAKAAQDFLDEELEPWLNRLPDDGLRDDIRADALKYVRRLLKQYAGDEVEGYEARKKSL